MKVKCIFVLFMFFSSALFSAENVLNDLLTKNTVLLSPVLENPEKFELQIIYTQIDRDSANQPHFTEYTYHVNARNYFYPASTVKLPAAVLALEKVNQLKDKGITRRSAMRIDSSWSGQTAVTVDSSSATGLPSIAHYIKKIFLVSDNDAFNRLYEFLGQQYFNERLKQLGFKGTRIIHRLSRVLTEAENRHTNPITFLDNGKTIFTQPMQVSHLLWTNDLPNMQRGVGYIQGDSLVHEPFDFSTKNYFSLTDMHNLLKRVLFPEVYPAEQRFQLNSDDLLYLRKCMGMRPGESKFPEYERQHYWDSYVKFFMYGDSKAPVSNRLRIFNKVGQAYGYLIDNAYIADLQNNIEFMLAAVIHVNENRIFNDGVYEYDTIGFPFLARLGNIIYNYEFERKRAITPDLSAFKLDYRD